MAIRPMFLIVFALMVLVADAQFFVTEFGRLCSGAKVQKVSSVKECKGYAAFMAKKHSRFSFKGTEETSIVPKGCYILQGGSFYWNTHSTGSAHSRARHVCKRFG